jgi:hypothetical protein
MHQKDFFVLERAHAHYFEELIIGIEGSLPALIISRICKGTLILLGFSTIRIQRKQIPLVYKWDDTRYQPSWDL